jgi:hypothetical protein
LRRTAPLLITLLALGGGARALEPVTPAPSAIVPAPPTVAVRVLPAGLQGRWEPVSQALQAAGPLTLTAQTLSWSPCGAVARAVRGETTGSTLLLSLPGQTACRLDGEPVTQLRLQPRSGSACVMELSVYESAAARATQQRLAWGVYERPGCTRR